MRLAVAFVAVRPAVAQTPLPKMDLSLIEITEPDGQILSYRHLADSTEVHMRGTRRAPEARVKIKVGSRPGFVELDINRGGITGLKPAHSIGEDFLTYVLWAVSVDGKASNLGEITFRDQQPVAVNLTTPYQTFWLMITAEPNYAVVDPSPAVVLYSVKQGATNERRAIAISRPLFFFTHYSEYESAPTRQGAGRAPNQLLQARKAVELASRSRAVTPDRGSREREFTQEALTQGKAFLARAEEAYKKDPSSEEVIQFARTAAQSAENARALATGAVGGLLVRQLQDELARLHKELAQVKGGAAPPVAASALTAATPAAAPSEPVAPAPHTSLAQRLGSLVRQPALWFAVAGWALAIALLFRRRTL
jgi:hypothetical protein